MKNYTPIMIGLIGFLTVAIASCSPVQVSYLGNDYGSSKDVELFFNRSDLPGDYRVMGEMILTAPENVKSEKVQRQLMREAEQKGANAALVEKFEKFQDGVPLAGRRPVHNHGYKDSIHRNFEGTLVKVSLIKYE